MAGSLCQTHQPLEVPRVSHEVSIRDTVLIILLKGILGIALSRVDLLEISCSARGKGRGPSLTPHSLSSSVVPGRLRIPAVQRGGQDRGDNNTDPLQRCLLKINEC